MKNSLLLLSFLVCFHYNSIFSQSEELQKDELSKLSIINVENALFSFLDETLQTNNGYSDEYYQKSLAFYEQGKYDSALIYMRFDSTASYFFSSNSPEYSRSLLYLSKIYKKLNKPDLALNVLNKALEIERVVKSSDKTRLKAILLDISTLYIITSDYKNAEPILDELIGIHNEAKMLDTTGYISALNNIAILSKQKADYKKAESVYKELINLTKNKYGNLSSEYSRVLNNYAALCNAQEKNDEAEALYKEIISIEKTNKNEFSKSYAITLNNLASLYLQTGRLFEAESNLKKAINIFEKLNDTKSYQYFSVLFNYARFQDYSGQLELAEKSYIKVLNGIEASLGNKNIQISAVLNNLSIFYVKQNKLAEAEEMMYRLIAMRLELLGDKHPSYEASVLNLSDLYRLKGQYIQADSLLEICLEIENLRESTNQPSKAVILSKKGILALDMAKYLQAEVYFRSALNINELNFAMPLPRMASEYANLGIALFHQNKKKEAKDCFIKSINTIQSLIKNYFPYCSEYEKAVYYDTLYSTMQKVLNYSIQIIDEYPDLLNSISSSILSHKAILFNYTQNLKNQVFKRADSSLINKFENWKFLKDDYARKYRSLTLSSKDIHTLDSTIQIINSLEKEITSSIGLSDLSNEYFNIDCRAISNQLKMNEEFVQLIRVKKFERRENHLNPSVTSISFSDSSFYIALIIHPSAAKRTKVIEKAENLIDIVLLENGFDIDSLAPVLYNNSIQLHRAKKIDLVQININQELLYSLLWEKIRDKLRNPKVVYFCPDGSYNLINLNTLINQKSRKYLIEEIDLRLYSTSFELLERSEKITKKSYTKTKNVAVLFGDPRFYYDSTNIINFVNRYQNRSVPENSSEYINFLISRYGLVSLPGSRKEIQQISQIFEKKKWNVICYLGEQAKEDSIKKIISPKVLHIATHGLFLRDKENKENAFQQFYSFENSPLLKSYLLFADIDKIFEDSLDKNKQEDGLLSAYEATNLKLIGTDLVVLSACETGLGTIRNGEGVYGLQRAFQLAGAKSVMMSLWNVSDLATQELMSHFYSLWLIKGKSKHQAFREAQLEIKDKYPNFYFWGAFVMVGE